MGVNYAVDAELAVEEVEDKYLICLSWDDSDQIGLDSILGLPT